MPYYGMTTLGSIRCLLLYSVGRKEAKYSSDASLRTGSRRLAAGTAGMESSGDGSFRMPPPTRSRSLFFAGAFKIKLSEVYLHKLQ
jgi:hypothetical protein